MQRAARALAILICFLVLPGCATKKLMDYAGKTEIRDNRVGGITAAWLGGDGKLVICAQGWPAERSRTSSATTFHMTVPLDLFDKPGEATPLLRNEDRRIKTYVLPEDSVAKGCPEKPEGARDIKTESVGADYFTGVAPRDASDDQIEKFVDPNESGDALYGFGLDTKPPTLALMYRHEKPVFGGSRLVWLDPGERDVSPNEAAYVAVPLAVAVDTAGIVIFIFGLAIAAVADAH